MSDGSGEGMRRRGSVGAFLVKGAAVSFTGRSVAVVAGVAIQVFLARLLTPAELGAFLLLQSVVIAAARIGQLGLHRTAVRAIAGAAANERFAEARGFVLPTLVIAFSGGSLVALAYWTFLGRVLADSVFSSPLMIAALSATALWILTLTMQNVAAEIFRGFHAIPAAIAFGGSLTSILVAAFLAICFFGDIPLSLPRAVWVSAIGGLASLAVALFFLGARSRGPRLSPIHRYRVLLNSALSLTAAGLLSAATSQLDLWIAGASLDQESVALYGSAKRLMRIVSLPLVMMNLVVPPLIAELHAKGDTTRLERAVRGAASLAGIPALVTLVAFVLWREELLGILYGDFYRQAGTILFFLTIERLAFVWSGPCALALTMTGHDAVMLRMTTIGSILAAVGAATGAALDGGRGIAIGVALAGIIRHSLMWWATRRECQIRTDIDFSSIPGGYEIVKRMLQRRMGR